MRQLSASIGGKHNAKVTKTWTGSFPEFVKMLLAKVPETLQKDSAGWVCGATFKPPYRDSENFHERHFLTFDYDHITPEHDQRELQPPRAIARGIVRVPARAVPHLDRLSRLASSRICGACESPSR